MALTRKFLKAIGLEDDKIDEIIAAHSETVDALKEQRDQYKTDAEKLPDVQRQLDDANAAKVAAGKDPYKVKYEALKEEFEGFKTDQTAKETRAAKETAYRALLKEAGISEKRMDAVLKVSDVDGVELVDGKIKDSENCIRNIREEWADFIVTEKTKGADQYMPPEGGPGTDYSKMTDDEYYKTVLKKE